MDVLNLKPQEKIRIDKKTYIVQPDTHPGMEKRPYIEWGGSGQVVQLLEPNLQEYFALKVFNKPEDRIIDYTESIKRNRVHELMGLSAANRQIITGDLHSELIQKYPEFNYAILMPWIKGQTWFEILENNHDEKTFPELDWNQSLFLAAKLAEALAGLEHKGLAHCDICSNNFIINLQPTAVELIDIEDMFSPYVSKNDEFIGGQKGYAHTSKSEHQWMREGDRFGGGILICEILCWHSSKFRSSSSSSSYFNPAELQNDNQKYEIMKEVLAGQGGQGLLSLLKKLWNSKSIQSCPPLAAWSTQLNSLVKLRGISVSNFNNISNFTNHDSIRPVRKPVEINLGDSPPILPIKEPRKRVDLTHPTTSPTPVNSATKSSDVSQSIPPPKKRVDPVQVIVVISIILILSCLCISFLGFIASNQFHPIASTSATLPTIRTTVVISTSTLSEIPLTSKPTQTKHPSITRTPSPTATTKTLLEPIPASYVCPDKNKVELSVGAFGRVRKYDLNLRKEPVVPNNSKANVIRVLRDGEKIKVLDGPTCAYDGTWWKVLTESGDIGWIREMTPSKGRLVIKITP